MYHNAILATGKYEGKLAKEDITQAAGKAGWHDAGKADFTAALSKMTSRQLTRG